MPILTRQLPVAAVAAVAMCAGVAPALAAPKSSTGALKAKTPLVAKIAAQADQIRFEYQLSHNSVQSGLGPGPSGSPIYYVRVCETAASAVERTHADAAQLTAKLEWVLGVFMEAQGDNAVGHGELEYVLQHPTTGGLALSAGLADYRLSNYYIGHADSSLGIPHRARNVEPYQAYRGKPVPPGPGTLSTPVGLAATIAMGTPALHEDIPDDVETTYVDANEAAASYYSVIVAHMHVDGAQRLGQLDWVKGVQTQLRGDELLGRGIEIHTTGNPATGNREMKDALGILREADSEISHADTLLGVHLSAPSATLPSHAIYYQG